MLRKWITCLAAFIILFFQSSLFAGQVAITIDDLPFVGHAKHDMAKFQRESKRFHKILSALQQDHVPATGFVIAGAIEPGQEAWLQEFRNAGNILGNHTYSHLDLNHTSAERYIDDLDRADKILTPMMGQVRYFRYPFLATGNTCEKYSKVHNYLKQHNYTVAPVTIDSKDYEFNFRFHEMPWQQRKQSLGAFRQRYLHFIEHAMMQAEQDALKKQHRPIKQIVLLHSNALNAEFLPDVIALFRQHGYQFITLTDALSDPVYQEDKSHVCLKQ